MRPEAVDRVKVRILVDNYYDVLLPSTANVKRVGPGETKKPLMAGHGYALFVEVFKGDSYANLLVDFSHSPVVLLHNMESLGISPDDVQTAFLTHGHYDHFGGLVEFARKRSKPISVYVHPDAFYPKLVVTPKGRRGPWQLDRKACEEAGVVFVEENMPSVVNRFFLVSGEIERTTDFERPWPAARVIKGDREVQDYFVDEQAVGVLVKDMGLVVISGCSHPGIVNIVRHMRNITQERILCVIGGFHWSILPEDVVEKSIDALMELDVGLVVPCHCTGFYPTCMASRKLGERFAVSSVGTVIEFGSGGDDA